MSKVWTVILGIIAAILWTLYSNTGQGINIPTLIGEFIGSSLVVILLYYGFKRLLKPKEKKEVVEIC